MSHGKFCQWLIRKPEQNAIGMKYYYVFSCSATTTSRFPPPNLNVELGEGTIGGYGGGEGDGGRSGGVYSPHREKQQTVHPHIAHTHPHQQPLSNAYVNSNGWGWRTHTHTPTHWNHARRPVVTTTTTTSIGATNICGRVSGIANYQDILKRVPTSTLHTPSVSDPLASPRLA